MKNILILKAQKIYSLFAKSGFESMGTKYLRKADKIVKLKAFNFTNECIEKFKNKYKTQYLKNRYLFFRIKINITFALVLKKLTTEKMKNMLTTNNTFAPVLKNNLFMKTRNFLYHLQNSAVERFCVSPYKDREIRLSTSL